VDRHHHVRAALTEGQLVLLRRIADGSRPLTFADSRLAASVYALRSRKLVSTTSQRHYWSATITDQGRAFLELGRLPASTKAAATPGHTAVAKRDTTISVPELVRLVQDAGGELRLVDPTPPERAAWRRAIHAAKLGGLPDGYRLRHSGRDSGDIVIRLVLVEAEVARPAAPDVRVPARLNRLHPILVATREVAQAGDDGWIHTMYQPGVLHLRVSRSSLTRALRIAQGLFAEAERRGHTVEAMSPGGSRCAGGAGLHIGGQRFELTFAEESDRSPHVLTAAEQARKSHWSYAPKWDLTPSGRLVLRHGHSDGALAADRVRWKLEDRLGRVLAHLEELATDLDIRDAQHAAEELRRRESEQRDWEEAMRSARSQLIESHRAEHLDDQIERWEQASKIRAFVANVRSGFAAPMAVDPKTEEWLSWATDYADTIDPLLGPVYMPETPKPTHAALEPFLDGWSPYGPSRLSHRYR
jgi:hypothetical protein